MNNVGEERLISAHDFSLRFSGTIAFRPVGRLHDVGRTLQRKETSPAQWGGLA
jgi:hypothetical protein